MHPQTPKNTEKKQSALTPSFTFGSLGPSPSSFRFMSPRNMNLLSTLSPHRLFNRFCKGVDEVEVRVEEEEKVADSGNHQQTHEASETGSPKRKLSRTRTDIGSCDSFHDSISTFNEQLSSQQNFHNASTVESFGTADEMDIWSFASDSHGVSMNLTAITEVADDKDSFFSPPEILLEQSPLESEVSVSQHSQTDTTTRGNFVENEAKNIRKRRFSSVHASPCTKVAVRAGTLGSPQRETTPFSPAELKDRKKVWTMSLDDELLRCFRKYNTLKELKGSKEVFLKGTSQNKILSRMLERKTGVYRTQKQISGRLLKLLKQSPPQITIEHAAESTPMSHDQQLELQATPSQSSQNAHVVPLIAATFEKFNMSFRYKDMQQRSHVFASLADSNPLHREFSVECAKQALPQQNSQFLADFDLIAPKLKAQGVAIHNVSCTLDLHPNFSDSSSPVSPMTNPRQFVAENGDFVSCLNVLLRGNLFSKSFVTLKSKISVYKNAKQRLFKSEESVNGYREKNNEFRLEIPFLNHFWAGFLTYIVNGSSDFNDLKNITISQMISDDSGPESNIYGFFVYKFSPTNLDSRNRSSVSVEVINLNHEDRTEAQGEIDEQETILASSPCRSSPFKPSPNRMNLRIHTDLANDIAPGPSTAPIFNSGLVHENNINYEFAKMSAGGAPLRPSMPVSKSTTNFNFEQRPATAAMLHANHSYNHGIRHHSAGQMGSYNPTPTATSNIAPGTLGNSCFYDQPSVAQPHYAGNYYNIPNSQQMAMNNMGPNQALYHQNPNPQQQMIPKSSAPHMAPGSWQISTNYSIPQEINSAPASQLQFFPPGGKFYRDNGRKVKEQGPPLKFHTMLQYDPSQGKDQKQSTGKKYHKFPAKPHIVFRAENK